MFSPTNEQINLCEQCGVALPQAAVENDCLHCLLTAGLEIGDRIEEAFPNEYNTEFYQHYEILTHPDGTRWELGRGSMGVTYRARDIHLNTPVALKLINARFAVRPDAQRRFLREAQAAARLRHPNVASVFHFGTTSEAPELANAEDCAAKYADAGDCFYAMEFVEGETLAARLGRSGPLSPTLALSLGVQVARALSAAEHRGLIHRDLKPSNIMLTAVETDDSRKGLPGEGWVKVIDFGLAKLVDDMERPTSRFIGTRAFASPEQVQAGVVDSRSDIYSLGATLWYSLTGSLPAQPTETSASELRLGMASAGDDPKPSGLPAPLATLLKSALALNPNDRPATALEFGQRLQNCLDNLVNDPPPAVKERSRSPLRPWVLASAASVIVAALIGTVTLSVFKRPPAREKSIAILPFRNLGSDASDAQFAKRVHADLLSRLDKVHNLKVINLVALEHYSAKGEKDLREVGRIFGIRHVLEGSLRRTKEHLYLHVALIDTWDGHELWAEGYDRSLGEAANLRGDLATGIADALDAILSLEESKRAQNPTPSKPDAHALYLRGRKFEQTLAFAISDYEAAEMLYTQAIALDPRFALAHARLASTLGLLYSFRGPDEELKSRAYAEVREALRLQPHLGEARLVSALCSYRLNDDFDRTRAELEHARQFLTDDIEAMSCLASLDRRRGAWRDAKSGMEHCLAREPENLAYQEELYVTAYMLRDWQAAEANAVRLCSLAPEQPLAKAQKTMVEVWKQGDVQPLHRLFTDIHSYGDAEGVLTWMRWDAAMMLRDPAAARAAIDDFPFETLSSVYGAPVPKAYLEGCLALLMGQSALAKAKFELCRPAYEAETLAHPENALRHARLGLLYAYLGRKENAIREGQRAVALIPTERDHVEGPKMLSHLALIYARVGESDKAIEMIQSLLPTPAGVFFGEASMSHAELRLRWQWDLLRPQSRFETILAAAEPHTTY